MYDFCFDLLSEVDDSSKMLMRHRFFGNSAGLASCSDMHMYTGTGPQGHTFSHLIYINLYG